MIINDTKLASFKDMIRNFADKNNLRWELCTDTDKKATTVTLGTPIKFQRYVVLWNDVPNLSEAAGTIFANAIVEFRLNCAVSSAFRDPTFEIKDVIFNDPATIVLWKDGTKTVVKCQPEDIYEKEVGLALCIAKKALGNQSNFNNVFKKWIPETERYNVVFKNIDIPIDDPYSDKAIGSFVDKMRRIFGGENT